MNCIFTLDASVFVSTCNPHEEGSRSSMQLLAAVREHAIPLIEPALMPIEVAAALRRGHGDAVLAQEYAQALLRLPHLTLVPLDLPVTRQAIHLASQAGLRGTDAVYAATTFRYGAILVTLDNEQRQRLPTSLRACTPGDALHLVTEPGR